VYRRAQDARKTSIWKDKLNYMLHGHEYQLNLSENSDYRLFLEHLKRAENTGDLKSRFSIYFCALEAYCNYKDVRDTLENKKIYLKNNDRVKNILKSIEFNDRKIISELRRLSPFINNTRDTTVFIKKESNPSDYIDFIFLVRNNDFHGTKGYEDRDESIRKVALGLIYKLLNGLKDVEISKLHKVIKENKVKEKDRFKTWHVLYIPVVVFVLYWAWWTTYKPLYHITVNLPYLFIPWFVLLAYLAYKDKK
jgi:hypothetical protein